MQVENFEKKVGYETILKQKNFTLYLLGQLISRFGDSIDYIAYGWMVYQLTGKTSLMALLFGVNAIPNIIFQPIAGVFVGYKKKKNVLFVCNFGRAIVVTITALMFLTGSLKVYHLFIFTFINSTFESFQSPASVSALPLILEKEHYSYGMSLRSTLSNVVELIGVAAAAGIISVIGISGGLLINAASFYICGILMALVKYKNETLNKSAMNIKGYAKDLKEGFMYMKNTKVILSICFFGSIFSILVIPLNSLGIAFVTDELHLGPEALAVINFATTSGMLIGSFIYPKLKEKCIGIKLFISSGIVLGISYLLMSFTTFISNIAIIYVLLATLSFVFGISASVMLMVTNVAFMEKTSSEYLSRVAGVFNSLVMTSTPVGSVIVAGLCVYLKTSHLYLLFGIGVIILFISQKYNKSLQDI